MAEIIKDGLGANNYLVVNNDGSINVVDLGALPIGSNVLNPRQVLQYDSNGNIGSIYKMINTGSYVKVLGYDGSNNLITISEWSQV